MELWKIILTAVGVALTLLLIAFRQRQLYLYIPKMFDYSPFSDKGRVVELTLINKSWLMEEDLRLEMPPELVVELLAADTAGVESKKSAVSITRLPQRTEVRLVLLVEGPTTPGDLTPKLTSKTSNGKAFKNKSNIPPNLGLLLLIVIFFGSAFAGILYGISTLAQKSAAQNAEIAVLDRKAAAQRVQIAALDKKREENREAQFRKLNKELDKLIKINNENSDLCDQVTATNTKLRADLTTCRMERPNQPPPN